MGHSGSRAAAGRATAIRLSTSKLTATFEHDGEKTNGRRLLRRRRHVSRSLHAGQSRRSGDTRRTATSPSSTARRASSTSSRRPATITGRCAFATRFTSPTPTARRTSQLGTTCYAWTSQDDELEEQTLKTLAASPFNKMRMCVFPKWYTWNQNEPPLYAFEGTPPNQWDFTRFNPAFFQHLEQRIAQLRDLGIEADIILFHPYDEGHWGFDRMPDEADDRYLRYVISRLAAFRNVWWSLANEYDFMKEKQESDWDRLIQVVHDADPYDHLTSIHNGRVLYNHTNPLLTHASIQNGSAAEEAGRAVLYRDVYRKPIVFDEIKYEGDIPLRWGNLSAEEMVHRFWECIIAGTYPGHGECYLHPSDVLWWAKGGVLRGESPARIAFLRDILATAPAEGIEPIDKWQVPERGGQAGRVLPGLLRRQVARKWKFQLPRRKRDDPNELAGGMQFHVDVLDTWNMTITPVDKPFTIRQPAEDDYVVVGRRRQLDQPAGQAVDGAADHARVKDEMNDERASQRLRCAMHVELCVAAIARSASSASSLRRRCTLLTDTRAEQVRQAASRVRLDAVRWTGRGALDRRILGRSLRDAARRARFPRCGKS